MALGVPQIVQSATVSKLDLTGGSTVQLTLGNPVTIGNQILMFVTASGTLAVSYAGFGGTSPPSGWASLGYSSAAGYNGNDNQSTQVYQQLATSASPPVMTLSAIVASNPPFSGNVTDFFVATMMEVANVGTITTSSPTRTITADTVTDASVGAYNSISALYIACVNNPNVGTSFFNAQPSGTQILWQGSVTQTNSGLRSQSAALLVVASNNPVSFAYTASTVPSSGGKDFVIYITPGPVTSPPTPPDSTGFIGVGLNGNGGTQDVVYAVVERTAVRAGVPYRYYTVEVMASRLLGSNLGQAVPGNIEYSWAVDAGVQAAPSEPAADIWITLGNVGAVGSLDIIVGGENYTAPVAAVIDAVGAGSGAEVTLALTGGVITGYTLTAAGSGYIQPIVQVTDSTGQGVVISAYASNTCTIYADAAVFTSGSVGKIIRASGGKVQVTAYTDGQHITGSILQPFSQFLPNKNQPAPCISGNWSIGTVITQMPYLDHLEGMDVVGVADGAPFGPLAVTDGAITLPQAASLVTVGLGYTAQLQTLRLDLGPQGGTIQSKRKKISATTIRVQDTQGLYVGSSWATMTPMQPAGYAPSNAPPPFAQGGGAQQTAFNGLYGQQPVSYLDQRILLGGGWETDGQICIQQSFPLPMSVLAVIPEITVGDQ